MIKVGGIQVQVQYSSSLAGDISRGFAARFWRLCRQNFISRAPTIPPATQANVLLDKEVLFARLHHR